MIEIVKDEAILPQDRQALLAYAQQRFQHRRKMPYVALFTIVASVILLFLSAFIPAGCQNKPCKANVVLDILGQNYALISWIEGFLAAVVGAYYGVSAVRPSS